MTITTAGLGTETEAFESFDILRATTFEFERSALIF